MVGGREVSQNPIFWQQLLTDWYNPVFIISLWILTSKIFVLSALVAICSSNFTFVSMNSFSNSLNCNIFVSKSLFNCSKRDDCFCKLSVFSQKKKTTTIIRKKLRGELITVIV